MRGCFVIAIIGNVLVVNACAQPKPDEFQSRAAASAVSSYLRDVDAAKSKYEKTRAEAETEFQRLESKARKTLVTELKSALKRETAEQNLKEALKIQETITELESSDPTSLSQPSVIGVWKIRWAGWPENYQSFRSVGNAIMIERRDRLDGPVIERGALQKSGKKFSFQYMNNSRLDRYSLVDDGRIFIEQWNLDKDREASGPPVVIGIATRVE